MRQKQKRRPEEKMKSGKKHLKLKRKENRKKSD